MSSVTITAITLISYKVLLILIGVWASRRNRGEDDFFLGGRSLGPLVAAISYSSSSSSAWTLLGISGIAYVMGISAIWFAVGSCLGMIIAWIWIAPALMRRSRESDLVTLTDLLLLEMSGAPRVALRWFSAVVIIIAFSLYVAAQFQGAATTFSSNFGFSFHSSVLIGAAVVLIYTMLGGFWAVSVTDTVQGLLMAATAIVLPCAALLAVGGLDGFVEGLQRTSSSDQLSWAGGKHGLVAAGFVLGIVSVGFGTFGQPHLLVRFMALRDERALRQARLLTIVWFCIVFFGMCFVGLAGRILLPALADSESVFFALSSNVLPPVLAAILVAAVLSAIMSTADSQLLVAASAVAHDLRFARGSQARLLLYSRVSVALMVALAVAIALLLPAAVFSRALFAWVALGAAFGPLTIARLANVGVTNYAALASVVTGFSSAVAIHVFIDSPAPMLQNLLPLSLAAACLVVGRPRTTDSAHPKAVVP